MPAPSQVIGPKADPAHIPAPQADPLRALFVLSVVRSGSSLLYTLLNQHSQIALMYEGDLPTMRLFLWGQFRNGAWRERWEFWNQGPSRNGLTIESIPAQVSDVWDATRVAYQSVARRKQAVIWGEKTPHWYDRPLRMAQQFPEARFIFLWRDVHGVMASIARAAAGERAFARLLARPAKVLLENEKLRHACDALRAQGRKVHEVDYEDLTSNTAECMQQICQFLEVPFEPVVTSLNGADRSAICPGEHHAMVRGNRIVGGRKCADVLAPAVRAKLARYICRWKLRSESKWPKYPLELPGPTRPVPFFELWRDRIVDESLQLWEKVTIVVLHQIRPRVYPKKYIRRREFLS
jgi:hypothetical protein